MLFKTAMGLVNTMIYLDEISTYPPWALLLVTLGIGSLVYGVLLLSASKEEPGVDSTDFEFDEEEMIEENTLSTGAWDTGSTSGASSSEGSHVEILSRDVRENIESNGGKERKFGDGRFFSIPKKSLNSKQFFKMTLLKGRKNKNSGLTLENIKDSNDKSINNYTTPHIIIDDEVISDENYTQEQQATTSSVTSPAMTATT